MRGVSTTKYSSEARLLSMVFIIEPRWIAGHILVQSQYSLSLKQQRISRFSQQ